MALEDAALKLPGQQSVLMLHRARDLLMRQRTMLLNAIRAHLSPPSVGPKVRKVLSHVPPPPEEMLRTGDYGL